MSESRSPELVVVWFECEAFSPSDVSPPSGPVGSGSSRGPYVFREVMERVRINLGDPAAGLIGHVARSAVAENPSRFKCHHGPPPGGKFTVESLCDAASLCGEVELENYLHRLHRTNASLFSGHGELVAPLLCTASKTRHPSGRIVSFNLYAHSVFAAWFRPQPLSY